MADVAGLIEALGGDTLERRAAQDQLAAIGEPAVLPLIAALEIKEGHRAWAAAEVLGMIRDPRAFDPLVNALRSRNPLLGGMAAKALAQYDEPKVVPLLVEALPAVHIITQQTIVMTLQKLADGRAVTTLIDLLEQIESATMRCAIIQTLGLLGDEQAIPVIRPLLNDENHHIREWAEIALGQLEAADS